MDVEDKQNQALEIADKGSEKASDVQPVQEQSVGNLQEQNQRVSATDEYQRRKDRPKGLPTTLIPGKEELLDSLTEAEKQSRQKTGGRAPDTGIGAEAGAGRGEPKTSSIANIADNADKTASRTAVADSAAQDQAENADHPAPKSETGDQEAKDKAEASKDIPAGAVGLNGKFQSPDGRRHMEVVSGACYEQDKLIGQLGKDGRFTPNSERTRTDINSSFDGWKFEGAEDGKARSFECRKDLASGRMFLPGQEGKNVECDVRMGMIIDKSTGEQLGTLIPPKESLDGKLQGGSVEFKEPPCTVPLADLQDAVFDLQLMGQTGVESRRLQGVSLGPDKMADGRPKPESGGLFNIRDGMDTLKQHNLDVDANEKNNSGLINYLSGEQQRRTQLNQSEAALTTAQVEALKLAVETGDAGHIRQIKQNVERIKVGDDPLLAQRKKLDADERTLESLPADTTAINGSVNLSVLDEKGNRRHIERQIKNGEILGEDGKPAFRIANENGQMKVVDLESNQAQNANELLGATWKMSFGEGQSAGDVTWVGAGTEGFVSLDDMRQKARDCTDFANTLKEKTGSDEAAQRASKVAEAEENYVDKLAAIREHGVQSQADLRFVLGGPQEVRKAALEAPKHDEPEQSSARPEQKPIAVPELSDSADPARGSFSAKSIKEGDLRIGPEVYAIKDGSLYQNGKQVGELQAGYHAKLDDGRTLDLNNTNRVVMKFKIDGDPSGREHRIVSLGPPRIAESGMKIQGGLVEADELLREGSQCCQKASDGQKSYFDKKPWLNSLLGMTGIDGSVEQLKRNVDTQMHLLQGNVDYIFDNAFKSGYGNNRLDTAIKSTQEVGAALGVTSTATVDVAREGAEVHKQSNDAIVTGVTTVATAGFGTWFTAGRALAAGSATGAAVSVVGRASNESSGIRNAASGAIEGFTNALGGVGGKWLQGAKEGQTISRLGEVGFRAADALTQSVLNTTAGAVREGDAKLLNVQSILVGAGAQLTGDGLGQFMGGMAGALEKKMAQNVGKVTSALNINEQELFEAMSKNPNPLSGKLADLGITESQVNLEINLLRASRTGTEISSAGLSAYANGFCAASPQAIDAQRRQIAERYKIDQSQVQGDMLWKNVNWDEVAAFCHDSGTTAAQSGMITSAAMRPVNQHMERRMAAAADDGAATPGRGGTDSSSGDAATADGNGDRTDAAGKSARSDHRPPEAQANDTADGRLSRSSDTPDGADGRSLDSGLGRRLAQAQETAKGIIPEQPHAQWKSTTNPDGTRRLESPFPNGGSVEQSATGQVFRVTDAGGTTYSMTRDAEGGLTRIEGSNGETFQKNAEGWVRNHGDKNETLTGVTVNDDGSITYEQLTRKPDGSVRDQNGKLVEANLQAERAKVESLINQVADPKDRAFLGAYLKGFETRQGFGNMSAVEAAKTLHEVSEILNAPKSPLTRAERAAVATEILGNMADAYSLNQGRHNTCNAATVAVQMYARYPSEAARIVKEAVTTGEVRTAGGAVVKLTRADIMPDPETKQAHLNEVMSGNTRHSERTLADKILQGAIVNTVWHNKDTVTLANGKELGPGKITWEHDANGKSSLKLDGKRVSDSPKLGMQEMQRAFNDLTGRTDVVGLAHSKGMYDPRSVQQFNTEESFILNLFETHPSPEKPITLLVNTDAEPFFSDSGAGKAGGSGGLHVVVITNEPVRINGELCVYVDNTWGPAAQHTAETGRAIPIRDLYMAAVPPGDGARIKFLQEAGKTDPVRQMEYLRAMEHKYHDVEQSLKNSKVSEGMLAALRKAQAEETFSPAQHAKKLQELMADLKANPSKYDLQPQELAGLEKQAAATIKKIETEGSIRRTDSDNVAAPIKDGGPDRPLPPGYRRQVFGDRDYAVEKGVKLEATTEPKEVFRQIDKPRLQNKFGKGDLNSQRILDAIRNGEPLPDYLPKGGKDAPISEKDVSQYTSSANDKCGVTAVTTDGNYAKVRGQHGDLVLEIHLPEGSPHITSHESVARGLDGEAQILVPGVRSQDIKRVFQVELDKATGDKKLVQIYPPISKDGDGNERIDPATEKIEPVKKPLSLSPVREDNASRPSEGQRLVGRQSDMVTGQESPAKQIRQAITQDRQKALDLLEQRARKIGPVHAIKDEPLRSVSEILKEHIDAGTSDTDARQRFRQWSDALKDFKIKGVDVIGKEGADSLAILLENGQVLKLGASPPEGAGKKDYHAKIFAQGEINGVAYHIQEYARPFRDGEYGLLLEAMGKDTGNSNFYDDGQRQGGMAKRWVEDENNPGGKRKARLVPVLFDYGAEF